MGITDLPGGTVTFVFSDIEGSTGLLKRLGDDGYGTLLSVHRRLVREIFAAHEGREIDTQGDAFFYSFIRSRQAVRACVELQRAHAKASWPEALSVRVRLGLHTGEPAVGVEGYTGLDVVRASRIAGIGSGGQILISDTTRAIVGADLPDGVRLVALGECVLKDIDRPEPIFELILDDERPMMAGEAASEKPAPGPMPEPSQSPPSPRPETEGQPSPARQLVADARQRIEERVLAQLQATLGSPGFPFGSDPTPSSRPTRSMTREISRLRELHESGALTDEQYRRAVDRILGGADERD